VPRRSTKGIVAYANFRYERLHAGRLASGAVVIAELYDAQTRLCRKVRSPARDPWAARLVPVDAANKPVDLATAGLLYESSCLMLVAKMAVLPFRRDWVAHAFQIAW